MSFRGNQNREGNFGGNNYGGGGDPMGGNRMGGPNMSPWEAAMPGGQFGNNMRQSGGGGGQGMNAQAINNLANNLLSNLFRNQNPPSLLDLPRGGGGGGGGGAGMGNRNHRGGPMNNRGGAGNRPNTRRGQRGFQNRGAAGPTPAQNNNKGIGDIRKQNTFDRAKKLLAQKANNKKKDNKDSGDKKTESKESPYASVPNDMFYCHLCKKHMWDANSFENHIKGRTHLMMREGIEESDRLKANMIRQEAKIAEQLKSIEFDRLKRIGKSKQLLLDYCTMCDLNFHGHISIHRKSDGHLQLKKFLHPKCTECSKEFVNRIDYDTHLLSAVHLKKAAEKNTKVGDRKHQTLLINTEEDELRDVRPPQKRKKPVLKKSDEIKKKEGDEAIGEKAEGGEADETKEGEAAGEETKEGEDLNESQEEEEVGLPIDPEDVILDYQEGDEIPTEVDARLPKYNWTRPVGTALIAKLECFECSFCGKFLDTAQTVEVHSRTVTHHRNFLKFINEKSSDTKIAQKRAAAAIEESGHKKRKLEEIEAAGSGDAEDNKGAGDVGELYDPSVATGDEDFKMVDKENGSDADKDKYDAGGAENGDAMDTQEKEQELEAESEPEPEPEPVPVKVKPTKPEPAVKTSPAKAVGPAATAVVAPATPVAVAAAAPANPVTSAVAPPTTPVTAATAAPATPVAAAALAAKAVTPALTPAPQVAVSLAKKPTPARNAKPNATARLRRGRRYNRY